jgi:hypothetical protein
MCDQLEALNSLVRKGGPSTQTANTVVQFLQTHRSVFEPSMWTAVSGSWDTAMDRVLSSLHQGDLGDSWGRFVEAWALMYAALSLGSCGSSTRYAIAQTPPSGPWGGRAICVPTRLPDIRIQRTYASRGECEMALQLLDPQFPAVPITSTVVCGQAGCDEHVSWAPKPSR